MMHFHFTVKTKSNETFSLLAWRNMIYKNISNIVQRILLENIRFLYGVVFVVMKSTPFSLPKLINFMLAQKRSDYGIISFRFVICGAK